MQKFKHKKKYMILDTYINNKNVKIRAMKNTQPSC